MHLRDTYQPSPVRDAPFPNICSQQGTVTVMAVLITLSAYPTPFIVSYSGGISPTLARGAPAIAVGGVLMPTSSGG